MVLRHKIIFSFLVHGKEIYPCQQHPHLVFLYLPDLPNGLRPGILVHRQSFAPQTKPVPFPIQHFQYPPRPTTEHEQIAGKRIVLQLPLHQHAQAVALLSHVRVSGSQEYAYLIPVNPHNVSNIRPTDDTGVRSLKTILRSFDNMRVNLFRFTDCDSGAASLTKRCRWTGSESLLFQYPKQARDIPFSRQYRACVFPLLCHSTIRFRQTSSFCCFCVFIYLYLLTNARQVLYSLEMGGN
jgi:hypothetical protein